ncbi:MAG: putative dehydrogenase [Parvicella sp.]|jgi:predicted dehydrogenase
MLKIGVVGAGHLGKIHLKILKEAKFVQLEGFYDNDIETALMQQKETGIKAYTNLEDLIDNCDIIDIVTPTVDHFEIAKMAIRNFKHVFIEKPIAQNAKESLQLITLSQEAGIKVQVGHVERFNPGFTKALPHLDNPMFIETHRLAQFNPRGTDVSVVLDLMIHDIDIVLSTVKSNVRQVSASGVSVVSDTPDIANARLEFDNGCVANLTASRLSMKNMRKSRFFQKDAYIAVDFLEKSCEIIQMKTVDQIDPFAITLDLGEKGKKQIDIFKEEGEENNAIYDELKTFIEAIENDTEPLVTIEDAHSALKVALEITRRIKNQNS